MNNRDEIIAAACHSAWYAYTVLALGEDGEPWDTAPDWQKESIRNAVKFWDAREAQYILEFPPTAYSADTIASWARQELPALSHANWCEHKRNDGWVYGEKKDPEAKTHPCFVPYEALPEDQKKKDSVVVEAYLAMRAVLG